jgi:hypothetical protein
MNLTAVCPTGANQCSCIMAFVESIDTTTEFDTISKMLSPSHPLSVVPQQADVERVSYIQQCVQKL